MRLKLPDWVINESLLYVPIYFGFTFLTTQVKMRATPAWIDGHLLQNHQQLINFVYTNNEQSRLLQFYIPEFFNRVFGLGITDAYVLQRLLFIFILFCAFHWFLRKWFSPIISLGGVSLLAATLPFTYINHLQESAPLLALTFLLGLWAIREKKDVLFLITMVIGSLNNETILALTAVYFFYRFNGWDIIKLGPVISKTIIFSLPAWVAFGSVRYITRFNPHKGDLILLPDNLQKMLTDFGKLFTDPGNFAYHTYTYIFFVFGILWLYPWLKYGKQDLFLKRASLIIPLFLAAHFITGAINEPRQMVPLAFLIIPMTFIYLIKKEES